MNDYHDEDEPVFFYDEGSNHRSVAEGFAASIFDGDRKEWEIWVRKNQDDPWQKFDVTVESVPSFSATPKCGE